MNKKEKLYDRKYIVGEDLEIGRYSIKIKNGHAMYRLEEVFNNNFKILIISGLISVDKNYYGVPKVELSLKENQILSLLRSNEFIVEKIEHELKYKLPTGIHIVGKDLPVGKFKVLAKGVGNFILQDESREVMVNEIIPSEDTDKLIVNFKDRQILFLIGIEGIQLEKI